MSHLTGRFATQNASKYLQQLCKHFGHKVPVSFDTGQGTVTFPMGTAHLLADESELRVDFDLDTGADPARAQHVIDSHLETFAFREGFKSMNWT